MQMPSGGGVHSIIFAPPRRYIFPPPLTLYAKRLERGRFLWPSPSDGAVSVTAAQLGYLLEGIDWRNPVRTWRPSRAG